MLARELGGERATCTTLVPPGASPHAFEPRPSALAAVAEADLLLRAGNGIDDWAALLAGGSHVEWVVVGPSCAAADAACAHFWLLPLGMAEAGMRLHGLGLRDSSLAERIGPVRFAAVAREVDGELRALFAPYAGAALLSFHPSWGDFAARYGLVDLGAIQSHGAEEPTPRHLAELISAARTAGARIVLVDAQLDSHTARIVGEELGARLVTVDPLGDPRDSERRAYAGLMRWNARQIAAALAEATP
jgi:ABC-type Zn uptake system ZnuABC Zn-binding protein ZnuA